jgi:hypothetical protein
MDEWNNECQHQPSEGGECGVNESEVGGGWVVGVADPLAGWRGREIEISMRKRVDDNQRRLTDEEGVFRVWRECLESRESVELVGWCAHSCTCFAADQPSDRLSRPTVVRTHAMTTKTAIDRTEHVWAGAQHLSRKKCDDTPPFFVHGASSNQRIFLVGSRHVGTAVGTSAHAVWILDVCRLSTCRHVDMPYRCHLPRIEWSLMAR